ncbi:MAG: HipA domain-containing protein [Desulfosarcina sp.]|nr:HipA domain-containing protein [Desulfosarcina sp.]
MNTCPITYQPCEGRYSIQGLKQLSPRLTHLHPLAYTAEEQLREAAARAPRMSIQGVQPKLSARLSISNNQFKIVTSRGRYVLKPQNPQFAELPENEDLSMRLAKAAGINIPLHGLIYAKDDSLTYFIRRFDRIGRNRKVAVEDFTQLMGLGRDTKYDGSMEKVAAVIERFCTFPAIDKIRLFHLALVNFLLGNEDMHLKNFSLITRKERVELAPAYDIVNTTIVLAKPQEEIALPIKGKKRKLTRSLLVDYFGRERLGLSSAAVTMVLGRLEAAFAEWERLIDVSFLDTMRKQKYRDVFHSRRTILMAG